MKTIILTGILGKKFGTQFVLDVNNAKEACLALSKMIPGFELFMTNAHLDGIRFAIWNGGMNIGEDEIDFKTGSEVIRIEPVIGAAKAGVIQTVIGAILVVVGVLITIGTLGGGAPLGAALIGAGVGMMVGGVISMLMPPMETDSGNDDGNKASKGFGGAVTTVAQGYPVPILYGERAVGGFLISGEIIPIDQV